MEMGGFRIATIRGIPIRIHFTFLLVLPFIAYGFARAFRAAAAMANVPREELIGSPLAWGLAMAIALFLSVLIHELAHSLYAVRKGGRVRDITLLMIGGVSQISEPPREARQEAWMALVGPVVSLALGGVLYLFHQVAGAASFNLRFALFYLGSLNIFLGLFNLLPAFPMDGGRILRSVLTGRMGLIRATDVAARVGKGFAILFAIWGFLSFNMLLLLIAFFVYLGAEGETRAVVVKALLGRLRVRDLMTGPVFALPSGLSVQEAAEQMLRERRLAFAVTADGEPVGLITLEGIRAVPPDRRALLSVRDIAVQTPPLSPADEAGKALRIMGETDVPELAVCQDGRLVGTISRDDIVRGLKLVELEETLRHHTSWPMRRQLRV
jgi:Zn-dependent protease/predicted transcriptional regulator